MCGGLTRGHSPNCFVKNDFAAQVLFVERLRQVGHDHDWKFQAFALVNAHQPDGVFLRHRGDLRLGVGGLLRLDEFQKAKQALPLKLIELLREAEEPFNVRLPLRAARTRTQPLGVMRFRQHAFQAL